MCGNYASVLVMVGGDVDVIAFKVNSIILSSKDG